MPLNLASVGTTSKVHAHTFDWRQLATYALGIGAKKDELSYLYETAEGGMRAYPTYAVVPTFEPMREVLETTGGDVAMVVHGGQLVKAHRPMSTSGTIHTTATIRAIYDLKKFGQVIVDTRSTLDGEPLFDTTWSIIYRGEGGFGGPRPAESEPEPTVPKDREPDWTLEEKTSPEQALLYRLSGDFNPLHADPAFAARVGFAEGPILHGLCTYGFAARAVVKHSAGGDAGRLRAISAQFRRPVWPGDTLVTQGWELGEGKVAFVTKVKERNEAVLGSSWALLG